MTRAHARAGALRNASQLVIKRRQQFGGDAPHFRRHASGRQGGDIGTSHVLAVFRRADSSPDRHGGIEREIRFSSADAIFMPGVRSPI